MLDPTQFKSPEQWRAELNAQEYRVLREGGTEAPFVGKYTDTTTTGVYHCRACGAELFRSDEKFASHCGWPSFFAPATEGTVRYPSGRTAVQVAPADLATIVWMVNLGTLRFHPWPVRAAAPDLVDQLRLDLDPQPGTDFADAVTAARELRAVLRDAGLEGFPKTSGGRGVHVFVPVQPVGFIEARHATIALGRELARRLPEQVTVNWWKEERGSRIFVDFNQMARDRLMTSAYSIRPTPAARVSAPLTWDELEDVTPDDFTVLTMPARFAALGDRWAALEAAEPSSVDTALAWYDRDDAAGEGELPYPPEYPKMPGEPPRVQPSKLNPANW